MPAFFFFTSTAPDIITATSALPSSRRSQRGRSGHSWVALIKERLLRKANMNLALDAVKPRNRSPAQRCRKWNAGTGRGDSLLFCKTLPEAAARGRPGHQFRDGQGCLQSRVMGPALPAPLLPKPVPEARCHTSPGLGTAG